MDVDILFLISFNCTISKTALNTILHGYPKKYSQAKKNSGNSY